MRDDLGKVRLCKSNYMCALEIKCLLARDSSYTGNSLPYNKGAQWLIYQSDNKTDEELISEYQVTKLANVDFAPHKQGVMRNKGQSEVRSR